MAQTDPSSASDIWGPVVRIDLDNPEPAEWVPLFPGGSDGGGFKPVYSPDGGSIAFGCVDAAFSASQAICAMDADGGGLRLLYDDAEAADNEVSWGPARQ